MVDGSGTGVFGGSDGVREFVRQAFVTGAAVTLPLIVTLVVVGFVVNFVSRQLDPVVGRITSATNVQPASTIALKLTAIVTLLALMFLAGVVAERRPGKSGFGAFFDTLVSRVPGVGSLYQSIEEMSSMLLDSDTDSFQEVKLVEFPDEGSYAVAFLTADTPDVVADAVGHDEMATLFLPMAPNPVMGGYVLHVSEARVFDVDMSVEEGIQSIVTSGVATGSHDRAELSGDTLDRFNRRIDRVESIVGLDELEQYAADASSQLEETARETVAAARSQAAPRSDNPSSDADKQAGADQQTDAERRTETERRTDGEPRIDAETDARRSDGESRR